MMEDKSDIEDYISHREKLPTKKKKAEKVIDINDINEHRGRHLEGLSEEERKIVCLLASIFVKNVLSLVKN